MARSLLARYMKFRLIHFYVRMFMPLLYAYTAFVFYFSILCYMEPPTISVQITSLTDLSHDYPNHFFSQIMVAIAFYVLTIVEVLVFGFVCVAVTARKIGGRKSHVVRTFFMPLLVVSSISVATLWVFESFCGSVGLLENWQRYVLGIHTNDWNAFPPFLRADLVHEFESLIAIVVISTVLTATCMLSPTIETKAAKSKSKETNFKLTSEFVSRARSDIAQRLKWLRFYLAAAAMYLVAGILYTKLLISSLHVYYFDGAELPNGDPRYAVANAIVGFNAILYVTLLVVVFGPVAYRLLRAGSFIGDLVCGHQSEKNRRQWLIDNGLAWSFRQMMQNIAAVSSPAIVPILGALVQA